MKTHRVPTFNPRRAVAQLPLAGLRPQNDVLVDAHGEWRSLLDRYEPTAAAVRLKLRRPGCGTRLRKRRSAVGADRESGIVSNLPDMTVQIGEVAMVAPFGSLSRLHELASSGCGCGQRLINLLWTIQVHRHLRSAEFGSGTVLDVVLGGHVLDAPERQ